jgi:ATP-dependent Clp protease protease subunit
MMPFGEPEVPTVHDRMRMLELSAIMPGHASYVYSSGMSYALNDPSKPINLLIRSNGGDVFEAINIVNALRDIRSVLDEGVPIIASVQGNAMSGASFVLQACDRRYAAANSIIMAHGITGATFRMDENDARRNLELLEHLRNILVDMYAERSTKPREWWAEALKSNDEHYFTAAEALEAGLIDEMR